MNLKNTCVYFQNLFTLKLITMGRRDKTTLDLQRLGSTYGGWYVPTEFSNFENNKNVLISAGIGHDVSFDIEMQKKGFNIVLLDPLQECCKFAENSQLDQSKIKIINAGLWLKTGKEMFHPPKHPNHVSWSITNRKASPKELGKLFNVVSLEDVIKEIKIDKEEKIIMLKIDIEGAERYLFQAITLNSSFFDYVAIELDYLNCLPFHKFIKRVMLITETRKNIKNLNLKGLKFVCNDSFNFYWVNSRFFDKVKIKSLM